MGRASVAAVTVAVAAAAALSGASPTGSPTVDVVLLVVFGAAVAAGGAVANRAVVVLVGLAGLAATLAAVAQYREPVWLVVAAALGLTVVWLALLAAAAGLPVVGRWAEPPEVRWLVGAITAGLGFLALLMVPPVGFFGLPSLLAAGALVPLVASAVWWVARRGLRLSAGATVAVLGLGCVVAVALLAFLAVTALRLRDDADAALADLNQAGTAARAGDAEAFAAAVDAARGHLRDADGRLGHPAVLPAFVTPGVAQQMRAVRTLVDEADALSAVMAASAPLVDTSGLYTGAGWLNFDRIDEYRTAVASVNTTLAASTEQIDGARSPWLVPPLERAIDRTLDRFAQVEGPLADAGPALDVLPGLLGADGEQRILVFLGSPAESRELGGFIGAYALLSANRDRLETLSSGPISGLYPFARELSNPEVFSSWYLQNDPGQFPQNLTATPSLSSMFDAVQQVFPELEGAPVDSVLYMDPDGMGALVDTVGTIQLPTAPVAADGSVNPLSGAVLDGRGVVNLAQRDQYLLWTAQAQNELMAELFAVVLTQILGGGFPSPDEFGGLQAAARGGHLALVSGEPETDRVLADLRLLREFPGTIESDFVSVLQSNGAASKLDAYLERDINYAVTVDPATGELAGTATVLLRSTAPANLPPEVIGNYPDPRMGGPPTGHRLLVSIVTPHDVDQTLVNGQPAPSFRFEELGLNRVLLDVEVPLGGQTELVFPVVGDVEPGAYELRVFKQALPNPDRLTVRVTDPAGQPLEPASGAPVDGLAVVEDLELEFAVRGGG